MHLSSENALIQQSTFCQFSFKVVYWSLISEYIFLPQLHVLKLLHHSELLPVHLSVSDAWLSLNSI